MSPEVDREGAGAQMRIYVGNLSYQTTEEGLRNLFGQHGTVEDVAIITDRETGRSRGFGFVTMGDEEGGNAAIRSLDGTDFEGRRLNVNQARPREDRRSSGW